VIPHQIIFSFFFILPIVEHRKYSLFFLLPFPISFSFFPFPNYCTNFFGVIFDHSLVFRNRFIPSANRFGIVWHPAASDKETSCQSSSVGLTQVGLCLNRSMALSGAFRPLGLVLPDVFPVRDVGISVFGLRWWITGHVVYLFRITL
jgi:hypothetical protein